MPLHWGEQKEGESAVERESDLERDGRKETK